MTQSRHAMLQARGKRIVEALSGVWACRSDTAGAMCRCPVHDDRTPSLSVRIGNRALLLKCFGAGCRAAEIIAALKRLQLWENGIETDDSKGDSRSRHVKPAPATSHASAARALWRRSVPLAGTLADVWLSHRQLEAHAPDLRYLARCPLGVGASAQYYPAMIAAIRNGLGVIAIQRTYLSADGLAKAAFDRPRRMLGTPGDGAVQLMPAGRILGLAEGIETALAAQHLLGIPVWATLGTERLGAIWIPPVVETLVLLPDAGASAERQTNAALSIYRERGINACSYPLHGTSSKPAVVGAFISDWPILSDWNDLLIRLREEGAGGGVTAGMFAADLQTHLAAVPLKPNKELLS